MDRRLPTRWLLTLPLIVGVLIQLLVIGLLLWHLALHRPDLADDIHRWLWQGLLAILLVALLAAGLFATLSQRLLRGIDELLSHTRLLATGHHPVYTPNSEFRELALLGGELNRMGHTLEAHRRQRRFNEQRLHDFAEVNADWLWELDTALHFNHVSGRFQAMLGLPAREMLGQPIQKILARGVADPGLRQRCLAELATHRPLRDLELPWTRADGRRCTLLISARPVLDEERGFIGYRGIGRDITRRKAEEAALRASEDFSWTVFDSMDANIAVLDEDGTIVAVNRAWHQFARDNGVGDPATVAVGANYFQVCQRAADSSPVASECLTGMHGVLAGEERFETIYPCHSPERQRWFLLRVFPLQREPRQLIVVHLDITERWLAAEQQQLMTRVFEHTADGIIIADGARRIQWVNPAFEAITGYSAAEVMGQIPRCLRAEQHDPAFYQQLWDTLETTDQWQGEIHNRRKDGTVYPEFLRISALRDESRQVSHYVGVFTDITALRAQEARLTFLAYHDPLTGLVNRAHFQEILETALQRAGRYHHGLAVLFVDLDGFKAVNDSLGHEAGDLLLQVVAQRLQSELRKSDSLARLGGDEFAVLLDQLPEPQHAAGIAQKLLEQLTRPIPLDGQCVYISGSIGIGCFPGDGEDAQTLLKHADIAMYRAKDALRNCFRFYSAEMGLRANSQLNQLNELRAGLAREEFLLYYQPCMELRHGTISRWEALLRWQPPGAPLRHPREFIALAEESGLIAELDGWVFGRACQQLRQWREAGLAIPRLAVNLSATQLAHADLLARLEAVLHNTGVEASSLDLEINETIAMRQVAERQRVLGRLKALGFGLTIDNFGTGYSSLSCLRRFPIDQLKIDRELIGKLPGDDDSATVVRAIIAMAGGLGLRVLADGVETEAQRVFLEAINCDEIQGYLLDEPAPAEAIGGSRWLAS